MMYIEVPISPWRTMTAPAGYSTSSAAAATSTSESSGICAKMLTDLSTRTFSIVSRTASLLWPRHGRRRRVAGVGLDAGGHGLRRRHHGGGDAEPAARRQARLQAPRGAQDELAGVVAQAVDLSAKF